MRVTRYFLLMSFILLILTAGGTVSYFYDIESLQFSITANWHTQADDLQLSKPEIVDELCKKCCMLNCICKHTKWVKAVNIGDENIEVVGISVTGFNGTLKKILFIDWNISTSAVLWRGEAESGDEIDVYAIIPPYIDSCDARYFGFIFKDEVCTVTITFTLSDGSRKSITL